MTALYDLHNSLASLLPAAAGRRSDKPAVIFQGQPTSYGALEGLSNQIANALARGGIQAEDCVGLYCINSPWFVAAYFAILKLGATVVPINLLLGVEEMQYILSDSQATGLIYFDQLEPKVAAALPALPALRQLLVVGRARALEARPLSEVVATESPDCEPAPVDQREQPAAILYTSGTTGRPKGAMLTHRNLLANVNSVLQALDIRPEDVFLTVLPMFHSFGATVGMITPIAVGATIAAVPQFLPDEVAQVIETTRATLFLGVPSMYTVFANLPDERKPNFSSLRLCVSGGAALPVEVMQRFESKYSVLIYEGDGPTECSPVTSVNPIGGLRKPGSIGVPIPGVEMRIVDQEGNEQPPNEVGEIVVRGENVMKGYLHLPQETQESFFGEWFRTGDMGYVDDDGYFYIVDRKKDMIIVNGMNVYPRMIEEVIYRHPAVAEVAVVAEPHPLHGEVPRAVIALKAGESATRDEILRLCRQHLGRHQVPRMVEFVSELPKTSTGKILKRALTRRGEVERGVDRGPAEAGAETAGRSIGDVT